MGRPPLEQQGSTGGSGTAVTLGCAAAPQSLYAEVLRPRPPAGTSAAEAAEGEEDKGDGDNRGVSIGAGGSRSTPGHRLGSIAARTALLDDFVDGGVVCGIVEKLPGAGDLVVRPPITPVLPEEVSEIQRRLRSEKTVGCRHTAGPPSSLEELASFGLQAETLMLAHGTSAERKASKGVLPPPVLISSGEANIGGPLDGCGGLSSSSVNGGAQGATAFMTRGDIQRMRAEMRFQCSKRQQDLARRRATADGSCPLFLSVRMRRVLEFAFRCRPTDMNGSTALVGGGAFEPLLLDDRIAQVVAALVSHHGLPLACVQQHLQEVDWSDTLANRANCTQDLYLAALDGMRRELQHEPLFGVEWSTPAQPRLPAVLPTASGPPALRLLIPPGAAAGADGTASVQCGSPGRLRSWFGPEDRAEGSEVPVIRRKINMTDLPIYPKRDLIVASVRENKVTLLHGETGSGKTTQVPQFIFEAERSRTEPLRIVVTQPRRIAAITVARRVAEELGEVVGEGAVGYKIRGMSVVSPKCRILFCTTGVLLRRLSQEGQRELFSQKTVTHLLVDEVHERSCETDFMLTFLKQVIAERPQLRVVLMSATMDAECFLRFFSQQTGGGAAQAHPPFLHVSGRCYPTHEVFLDTIHRKLGRSGPSEGMSYEELRRGNSGNILSENDGIDYELIVDILREIDSSEDGAWCFLSDGEHDIGDVDRQREDTQEGAVLVFMPGAGEISRMLATLEESSMPEHWWALPLHGALPAEEQQDAFRTVLPDGKTWKIIVCTNVAETSVTVPDVTVVIDSCRERRTGLDRFSNTPQLKEQWCAQDSLMQRRGRAGRLRPGVCLRLLSKKKMEGLETKTPPEMQRVPLENVYLQLCACGVEDRSGFLARTPDPPTDSAVLFAHAALQDLGALDDAASDGLTPLGRHLASLPCHPRLGKILLFGCLFSVASPVLSICAAMSGRSPLRTTQDTSKRATWQAERRRLLESLGHKSDHCAWAVLLQLWMSEGVMRRVLTDRYGLSYERMSSAWFERKLMCEALVNTGFLPEDFLQKEREQDTVPAVPDWEVVRAVVAGGLFPNLVHAERTTPRDQQTASGPGDRNKWMRYSILQRQLGGDGDVSATAVAYPKACNMHPNSLCFGEDRFDCPWLAYYTIQQTTKLYVYDATEASPWALLLFGSQPVWNAKSRTLEVGCWARFRCAAEGLTLPLLNVARVAVDAILARKARDHTYDVTQAPELAACVELLRTGGLGYEPLRDWPEWPFLEELRAESTARQVAAEEQQESAA